MMRFALLAAAALMVLLLRPACDLLPTHAAVPDHPASCCASVEHAATFESWDLATPGTGGKALVGARATSYLAGAAFVVRTLPLFASGSLPSLSFHLRSARILR